jgi:hypothetical protein
MARGNVAAWSSSSPGTERCPVRCCDGWTGHGKSQEIESAQAEQQKTRRRKAGEG